MATSGHGTAKLQGGAKYDACQYFYAKVSCYWSSDHSEAYSYKEALGAYQKSHLRSIRECWYAKQQPSEAYGQQSEATKAAEDECQKELSLRASMK